VLAPQPFEDPLGRALVVNLGIEGGLQVWVASDTIVVLGFACVGMSIGQMIRLRLSPAAFSIRLFAALLFLDLYLVACSVV